MGGFNKRHSNEPESTWPVFSPYGIIAAGEVHDGRRSMHSSKRQHSLKVKSADDDFQKPYVFRVDTADRVLFLVAASASEKEGWIGAIGRQMVTSSIRPTYCEDDIVY